MLRDVFAADEDIEFSELWRELKRNLPGSAVIPKNVEDAALRRRVPVPAGFSIPMDVRAVVQQVLAELSDDERRHFVPKAQGAELGEVSWYFEGREDERHRIVDWLRSASSGLRVVTGRAGSGKSALLGDVLVRSRLELSRVLVDHGLLASLAQHESPPPEVFDTALHLTGLNPVDVVDRLSVDLQLADTARREEPLSARIDALTRSIRERKAATTILVDALDEAVDPLTVAAAVLRPLVAIPGMRVVVGTRRSTHEGPDQPEPDDQNLIDALGADRSQTIEVSRDPLAISRYVCRRLLTGLATQQLDLEPAAIDAVGNAIAAAGREFLFARLAVHELLASPELLTNPIGLTGLLGGDHRTLFASAVDRLRRRRPAHAPLLRALGFAQGRGLPMRDGVWAAIANALSEQDGLDHVVSDADISVLLYDAAPYIMIDSEHGQTVYRLAHRTFVEHFRSAPVAVSLQPVRYESRDVPPDADRRIAQALLNLGDQLGWDKANPYVSRYLPEHASLGKVTNDLLCNQGALDHVDQHELRAIVVPTYLGDPAAPRTARTVIRSGHLLQTISPSDRPALRALVAATDGEQPGKPSAKARWWPRWARLAAGPPHVTITGHPGGARSLAVVPLLDGSTALVTIGNGQLMLWNPLTTRPLRSEPIRDELSPGRSPSGVVTLLLTDGRTVLCAQADDTVWLWDLSNESPSCLGAVQTGPYKPGGECLRGHTVVRLSSGQLLLATCGTWDGTVRLWDIGTGTPYGQPLKSHKVAVMALIALPTQGGELLASFDHDGSVRLWDPSSGKIIKRSLWSRGTSVRSRCVTLVRQSGAPPILATGDDSGRVRLWDSVTFKPTRTLSGHRSPIVAAFPWPQRNSVELLVTISADGEVRLWDPVTGSSVGQFFTEGKTIDAIVVPLPDRRVLLATTSEDGAARLWDLSSSDVDSRPRFPSSFAPVAAVPLPGGDTLLATGSNDCTVRLWNSKSGELAGKLYPGHKFLTFAIPVPLSDNRTLLATADAVDDTVLLWDPSTEARVGKPIKDHTLCIYQIVTVTLPDGRTLLATLDGAGRLRVWDVSNPTKPLFLWYDGPLIPNRLTKFLELSPLLPDHRRIRSLISLPQPNGQTQFATRSEGGVIALVDPATGEPKLLKQDRADLMDRSRIIASVPIIDGRTALATPIEEYLHSWHLWDPATGELFASIHDLSLRISAAVSLSDGCTLLADACGASVHLWSVAADGTIEHVTSIQLIARAKSICALPGPALAVGTETGTLVFDLLSFR
ncbi:MAG: WD40 repeat domain-containing protein [Pseudonocardia sp.]